MEKRLVAVLALLIGFESGGGTLMFYDIVPYAPGREAETARDVLRVHEQAGLDTFLYSVSLDPRGCPAFNHVKASVASYRKLKEELKGSPVKLGFLLQSIIGHWPRVDGMIEPWQRTVNIDGEIKRFCVLDGRYQAYIRDAASLLAKETPCFILSDDDIRAFSPKLECFCPLHAAEFSRRIGKHHTTEEYCQAVRACSPGDPVWKTCMELRDEIPMMVVKLIREGIDSVDRSIHAGVCTPGAEQLLMVPRAKIMAGMGNPVTMRIPNGRYAEIMPHEMAFYMMRTQAFIDFYKRDVDMLLDESDTFPHTLYSRSGRSFAARLALGIFCGLRGAKIWFVGMSKCGEKVPEQHTRALGGNRRFFLSMAEALDGSLPVGLRIPASVPAEPSLDRQDPDFFGGNPWPEEILGAYGIPFYADFSRVTGDPVLLGGTNCVRRLSDAELIAVLKGCVLVDGASALELSQRGLSAKLGCCPVVDVRAFNVERVRSDGSLPPVSKSPRVPALTDVDPAATVCSDLLFAPTGDAMNADLTPVAAGSLMVTNDVGGRVFVTSFDVNNYVTAQNLRRKAFLIAALRCLDPSFPAVCENAEPNLTVARKGHDGRTYVFTVNLSYDDMEALTYSSPRSMVDAEVLEADGKWHATGVSQQGACWRIPRRLPILGFSLMRY